MNRGIDYEALELSVLGSFRFVLEKPENPEEYDCWMEKEDPENPQCFVWLNGEKVLIDISIDLFCELCEAETRDLCICDGEYYED